VSVVPYRNPDAVVSQSNVDPALQIWLDRRKQGLQDRKRYEADWQLCRSYLANKQWVGWDKRTQRVMNLANPANRERYVVNVITQYYWTIAGKLATDDFRPQLFFREDDIRSIEFASQANRAVEYCWTEELEAEDRIFETLLKMCAYGTSGIQCRFDPTQGSYMGMQPMDQNGQMMQGPQAYDQVSQAVQNGTQAQMQPGYSGKLCWEPLSPFNVVPPPGIENERNFPWLILDRPVDVNKVLDMFGKRVPAQSMVSTDQQAVGGTDSEGNPIKLKGQTLVSTGYQMPTQQFPQGRTVWWTQEQLLNSQDRLPYVVDGCWTHGVRFFKYHRIPNRFWAVGVVEPLLGPQRERNRSRSQYIEMKDRGGLGRIYARPGSLEIASMPEGKVMEIINVRQGHDYPQETQGTGVGPWIKEDVEMHDLDMDKVAGTGEVSLGTTPGGVSAYSAMALLAEQDDRRVGPILKAIRSEIASLVKLTLEDIRQYWPPNKQIQLAGQNHLVEAFVFNSNDLPASILVEVGTGAPVPKNQAAEVQKIFDLFDRGVSSSQPLELKWLYDSLAAGKALPIPDSPSDVQGRLAENENMLMARGVPVQTHPSDDASVHIAIHDSALAAAQLVPGMDAFVQLLTQHIQEHEQEQAQAAASAAASPNMQGPLGALGGQPPGSPTPPNGGGLSNPAYVNRLSPLPGNVQAGMP